MLTLSRAPTASRRQQLSDAQVWPTVLVAARFYGGPQRLHKRGFTRRRHLLTNTLPDLFATCGQVRKDLHTAARYRTESCPMAVYHNCASRATNG